MVARRDNHHRGDLVSLIHTGAPSPDRREYEPRLFSARFYMPPPGQNVTIDNALPADDEPVLRGHSNGKDGAS
jgi:hypothetical protein